MFLERSLCDRRRIWPKASPRSPASAEISRSSFRCRVDESLLPVAQRLFEGGCHGLSIVEAKLSKRGKWNCHPCPFHDSKPRFDLYSFSARISTISTCGCVKNSSSARAKRAFATLSVMDAGQARTRAGRQPWRGSPKFTRRTSKTFSPSIVTLPVLYSLNLRIGMGHLKRCSIDNRAISAHGICSKE